MRRLLILACVVMSFWAGAAHAQPPVTGGVYITGKCSSTGAIASPQDVAAAAEWTASTISEAIMEVGRALQGELQEQTATMIKLSENEMEVMRNLFVNYGAAQERAQAQRMYGSQAVPDMGCAGRELGAGIQVGKKAEALVSSDYAYKAKEHNAKFRTGVESYNWLKSVTPESITTENLIPTSGTYPSAEAQRAARDISSLVSNPHPSPPLEGAAATTQQGQQYENARKVKEARLILPQKVLADIAAGYSPTMELGQWAQDVWAKSGGQGTPAGIVEGKISSTALLNMLVNAKFGNPNWYDQINVMNDVGLQREQLHMLATLMEVQLRQLSWMEKIAGLLAQREAGEIMRTDNPALEQLQKAATGSKNESN